MRAIDAVAGRVQAGQEAQQGCLALAVGPDQADAVALFHAQIHPLEYVQRAEALGEVVAGEDGHGDRIIQVSSDDCQQSQAAGEQTAS